MFIRLPEDKLKKGERKEITINHIGKTVFFAGRPNYWLRYHRSCNYMPFPYRFARQVPHCVILEGVALGPENVKNDIHIVDGKLVEYQLPSELAKVEKWLLEFHKQSKCILKNLPLVRLYDYHFDKRANKLFLIYEKTSYYKSVTTNDSIDLVISPPEVRIRDILEPYGKLSPFKSSLCSNHLGVDALLILKDGYIPLRVRSERVFVAPVSLETSVSGTFKYSWNDPENPEDKEHPGYLKGKKEGYGIPCPFQAVKAQAYEELGLEEGKHYQKDNIFLIGFSRDLIRGGKPQLFFIINADINKKEFEHHIKNFKNKSNLWSWEWVSIRWELEANITKNSFKEIRREIYKTIQKVHFKVNPSLAANLYFFLRYLQRIH